MSDKSTSRRKIWAFLRRLGAPTDGRPRSRGQRMSARGTAVLALVVITIVVIGFTQGWFTSSWLRVVAVIGVVLGVGGILRTFIDKEARGEAINLVAVAVALIPLILAPQSASEPSTPESSTPEPPMSPANGLLPYRVTGTGELGLLVRSCADENCGCTGPDCALLGTAGEHSQVWVECSRDSGYAPPGEPNSIWYRIRWSNTTGGTRQFFNSSPTSPHLGWIFSRYVTAAGPNDTPPSC